MQAAEPKTPGTAHLKCVDNGAPPPPPLHRAAAAGNAARVTELLDSGTDPALHDASGRTAYEVAASKEVRDAMRRFVAAQPERWDYSAARIPSALHPEMEEAQV